MASRLKTTGLCLSHSQEMAKSGSLLERLAYKQPSQALKVTARTEEIADSVLRHLRKMLNTRQGQAAIAPEYGMPDVTDYVQNLSEAVDRFRLAIKSSIEMYEPRLKRPVRITFANSEYDWPDLRFEIVAKLRSDDRVQIRFETTVEPSGHVLVKK